MPQQQKLASESYQYKEELSKVFSGQPKKDSAIKVIYKQTKDTLKLPNEIGCNTSTPDEDGFHTALKVRDSQLSGTSKRNDDAILEMVEDAENIMGERTNNSQCGGPQTANNNFMVNTIDPEALGGIPVNKRNTSLNLDIEIVETMNRSNMPSLKQEL